MGWSHRGSCHGDTVCGPPKTVLMMSFYGNLDAGEPAFKVTGRVKRGVWREPETRMWPWGYFSQAAVPVPAWNSLFNALGVSVFSQED